MRASRCASAGCSSSVHPSGTSDPTLRDVHKIGERLVHPLHMLGIGRRVPNPETIGVCIQIASQEYALVSALRDTFGQDLPCMLLELHVASRRLMHIEHL